MHYNDELENNERGILYVIEKLEKYGEEGFIASLYVRNISELDILMKITEVRECLCIAHKEFLSLTKFSLNFNTRFATEDNERFSTAQLMLNRLRSSLASIKRNFRESCPINRKKQPTGENFRDRLKPSIFDRNVLVNGGCARDLFGIKSFDDNVQTLYIEQRALFACVLASLMLCYKEIEKERQIRANPDQCVLLFEQQCMDIQKDLKDIMEFTQFPVTCKIQQKIEEMGLRAFAQDGFHKYNPKNLKTFAIFNAKQRSAESNINQFSSIIFGKDVQKAKDAELLIQHFDEFRPETRKKLSSIKILLFINWCTGRTDTPDKVFHQYLKTYYRKQEIPSWHAITTYKNKIKNIDELQKAFNEEVELFLNEIKKAA